MREFVTARTKCNSVGLSPRGRRLAERVRLEQKCLSVENKLGKGTSCRRIRITHLLRRRRSTSPVNPGCGEVQRLPCHAQSRILTPGHDETLANSYFGDRRSQPCMGESSYTNSTSMHAFASVLQLLGGSSLYLTKNGLAQADGTSKWSIVCLGRVIALFFDEQTLFGRSTAEVFHPRFLRSTNPDEKSDDKSPMRPSSSGRRKRHVRNNFELFDAQNFQSSPESTNSSTYAGGSPTRHPRRLSDIPNPNRPYDSVSQADTLSEVAVSTRSQNLKELKVIRSRTFKAHSGLLLLQKTISIDQKATVAGVQML